jgi:predicted Fe-Mo cluster-binding NifX family protein
MKIAVSSTGPDLDAAVDPRFGRCAYFAVLDTDSGVLDAVANPFLDAAGGAGTQAAQWILDRGIDVLVTGRCGPKAAAVLGDAGIRVVEGVSGTVREAAAAAQGTEGSGPGGTDSDSGNPAGGLRGGRHGQRAGVCGGANGGRGIGRGLRGAPGRGQGLGRGRGLGRGLGRQRGPGSGPGAAGRS